MPEDSTESNSERIQLGRENWPAPRVTNRASPPVVYHYTTTHGLLGILESRNVWATHLAYLNDSSELEFGLGCLLDMLVEMLKPGDEAEKYQEQYDAIRKSFPLLVKQILTLGVTCFCEDGDSLGQWRGYGVGGYSIGFDSEELEERTKNRYLPLASVAYGKPYMNADGLTITLRNITDAILATDDSPAVLKVLARMNDTLLPLMGMSAQIKDPAFTEEREWRIGEVGNARETSFRAGQLGVIPYIDLSLCPSEEPRLPIDEIYVAPGPEADLRKFAVESLLKKYGYIGVQVHKSDIPFRP